MRASWSAGLWLLAIASALPAKETIQLVAPHPDGESAATVTVTDARPAWQKQKEILSLWRTACDFAIVRWGDDNTQPARAQAVAEGLGKHLDASYRAKAFTLTWFTLHTNRRAPPDAGYNPYESGLAYDALKGLECRKGGEMIGGVAPEEASPPAPLVVDIVVKLDGQEFAGRAVSSVSDTNAAAVKLVDQAIERLAHSIQEGAPAMTPCDRLEKARDANPKDGFYQSSYRHYCLPAPRTQKKP